jgi:predicted XRE-type DNA-binding protein
MAQSARAPGLRRRGDQSHLRSLKESLLWEIALAIEQHGLTDEAAAEVTGERIETLQNVLQGRYAAYGIVRLMRTLARLGVPVSLSVTPASTMIRAGERKTVIRYRT